MDHIGHFFGMGQWVTRKWVMNHHHLFLVFLYIRKLGCNGVGYYRTIIVLLRLLVTQAPSSGSKKHFSAFNAHIVIPQRNALLLVLNNNKNSSYFVDNIIFGINITDYPRITVETTFLRKL